MLDTYKNFKNEAGMFVGPFQLGQTIRFGEKKGQIINCLGWRPETSCYLYCIRSGNSSMNVTQHEIESLE